MPKLPVVTSREMIQYLQCKGFVAYQGSRHVVLCKGDTRTQVPQHGNEDLGKGLLREILRQARISTGFPHKSAELQITCEILLNQLKLSCINGSETPVEDSLANRWGRQIQHFWLVWSLPYSYMR